uniref:Bilaris n=1 Tax=Hyalomma rufipes TaxID=72862 RepID=E2J6Q8_HYARU
MAAALVTIFKSSALVVLVLAELQASKGVENATPNQACKTPTDINPQSEDSDIMYIYNETSRICHTVLASPKGSNVFDNRIKCIQQCSTDQEAKSCTSAPANACSKEKMEDTNPASCDDIEKDTFPAYYYNARLGECTEYCVCGYPKPRTDEMNFFMYEESCEFWCGGYKEYIESKANQG